MLHSSRVVLHSLPLISLLLRAAERHTFHNKQLIQVEEGTGIFLLPSLSHPASSPKDVGERIWNLT